MQGYGGIKLLFVFRAEYHLFAVHNGVFGIWREGERGRLGNLIIMLQAAHAAFLVAAQNKPYAAPERYAAFLYGLHGVQRRKRGALVVHGAAGIKLAVVYFAAVGGIRPARALRHNVQMAYNAKLLITACHIYRAAVAVVIHGIKPKRLAAPKRIVKRFSYHRPKRRTFACMLGILYARYAQVRPKRLYQFFLMIVYPFVNSAIHTFPPLLYYRAALC